MTELSHPTAPGAPAGYDPAAVERKWQERWEARGTNHTDLEGGARPFYALMMFPYPSAEGLHVGNLFAFTGNDIYGRFQRLQGHTVFEPLGFDAFGIHSENFALKMGVHPAEMTPRNVANFRRQLERAGLTAARGGYRVFTTLDPPLQRRAEDALRDGAARVEARPGYRHPTYASHARGSADYLQGMVVALDPRDGDVLALVGGRDYAESQFNRAVNGQRQPGSSFKPIVYSTAVASLIPANEIVYDTALAIPIDHGPTYRPENADGLFLVQLTMREALVESRNPVAVQLGMRVGMDSVVSLARQLGI